MPTTVVKSIGTAGGRDYTTWTAWEDAAPANLVTADQVWRGECYNDSAFTGSHFSMAGSTSDATRYKELTVAAGQSFADHPTVRNNALRFDSSRGVYMNQLVGYGTFLSVSEMHARVSRLQIRAQAPTDLPLRLAANSTEARDCVVHSQGNGGSFAPCVLDVAGGTNCRAVNCVVVQERTTGGTTGIALQRQSEAINCTIVMPNNPGNSNAGLANYYGGDRQKNINCAVFGFGAAASAIPSGTGSASAGNVTDVASPGSGWTGSTPFTTATFENVTLATLDLRIKDTGALKDAGTATGAPTVDITGIARPQGAAHDTGAWEVAAAAAATSNAPRRGGPSFNNLLRM